MAFHYRFINVLSISVLCFLTLPCIQATILAKNRVKTCENEVQRSLSKSYDWSDTTALSLAQCLQQLVPQKDACVFYTSGNRYDAIDYAVEHNMTTIYDVYEPRWFNTSVDPARTWSRNGHLRKVFQVTSRSYAISCSGQATLVMPQDVEPCPTSIWITDEYDAIQSRLSKITHVLKASHVLMEGIWGWITTRVVSLESSAGLKKRGVDEVTTLQKVLATTTSSSSSAEKKKKKHSVADAFRVDDVRDDGWALQSGTSCAFSSKERWSK